MAKKPEKEAPAPEGEEGAEGEAPAKKKPPILIIAIAAGVLVLGGGGAAAFFLLKPKPAAEAGEHGKEKKEKKKEKKEEGGHGEKKEGEGDARVVERHYGSFSRSFTLPSGVDEAKISAKYDKGVLSVVLPKRPEAEAATRRIAIGK